MSPIPPTVTGPDDTPSCQHRTESNGGGDFRLSRSVTAFPPVSLPLLILSEMPCNPRRVVRVGTDEGPYDPLPTGAREGSGCLVGDEACLVFMANCSPYNLL